MTAPLQSLGRRGEAIEVMVLVLCPSLEAFSTDQKGAHALGCSGCSGALPVDVLRRKFLSLRP
ncbi:hypothetical protein Nmel_011860 [Mimus melanotis]